MKIIASIKQNQMICNDEDSVQLYVLCVSVLVSEFTEVHRVLSA